MTVRHLFDLPRESASARDARPPRLARQPAGADPGRAGGSGDSRGDAPDLEVAIVPITTTGDRDRTAPFGELGDRGVFVKELEEALLAGRVDIAVHSAKDMTSTATVGLSVGAYLPREDARDALVWGRPAIVRVRIGTASYAGRRSCSRCEPLFGRAAAGKRRHAAAQTGRAGLDAIVLAAAGLDRLGLSREIGLRFDPDEFVPEAGQGAWRSRCARRERPSSQAPTTRDPRGGSRAERACVAGSAPVPRARGRAHDGEC